MFNSTRELTHEEWDKFHVLIEENLKTPIKPEVMERMNKSYDKFYNDIWGSNE